MCALGAFNVVTTLESSSGRRLHQSIRVSPTLTLAGRTHLCVQGRAGGEFDEYARRDQGPGQYHALCALPSTLCHARTHLNGRPTCKHNPLYIHPSIHISVECTDVHTFTHEQTKVYRGVNVVEHRKTYTEQQQQQDNLYSSSGSSSSRRTYTASRKIIRVCAGSAFAQGKLSFQMIIDSQSIIPSCNCLLMIITR